MASIRLSPDELDSYASKLRSNASEAINLASAISNNINGCADGWEGNKRDQFVAQFEEIKPTLTDKLPRLIEDMAKALNDIANNFRAADQA